jgi:toluene monooxygenase electron transfer component
MNHRITTEGGGVFDVSAEDDTLLRAALRAGVGFPHDCSVGGCGNCRFELVSGEMETLWSEAPGLSERDRRRGRRLACQSRPLGDCTIRVRISEEYRPTIRPRLRRATLVRRTPITADISEFVFATDAPAEFLAGQYALLHPRGVSGVRAYSMSNLPNAEGDWHFAIRRVPGGRGSNALFDKLKVGDAIPLDGPFGHAWFREEEPRDTVCIAGGSGIGPIVSIVRAALREEGGRRIRVFEGARTREDLCFPGLFGAALDARIDYTPVLSAEPETGDWIGARGFVHAEVERLLADRADACEFYFAGPPPMIEAIQDLLIVRWTVPIPRVHYDRFF